MKDCYDFSGGRRGKVTVNNLLDKFTDLSTDDKIVFFQKSVEGMTLGTVVKLVKQLEEEWDVEAAPSLPDVPKPQEEEEVEPTEFSVYIKEIGPKKIKVVRAVRGLDCNELSLKGASDLLKQPLPIEVAKDVSMDRAENYKNILQDEGAVVEIK
jgi:large subunit ribosomal protein L7/L12